jgi:hypothetical protein
MSLQDIKARIAAVISGVNGIGKVYDRMRVIKDEKTEQSDLISNGKMNCWFVTRESKDLEDMNQNQSMSDQYDMIVVHGFYGVDDANDTEQTMDTLTEAVLVAINADRRPPSKLNGKVVTARPPKLRLQDYRNFGPRQVLCHHAEISITVQQAQLQ